MLYSKIEIPGIVNIDYSLASLQDLTEQTDLYLEENKKIKEELDNAVNKLEKINPVDSIGRGIFKIDEISGSLLLIKTLAERGNHLENHEIDDFGKKATELYFEVGRNIMDYGIMFIEFRENPDKSGEQAIVDEIYSLILKDLGLLADFTNIAKKVEKFKINDKPIKKEKNTFSILKIENFPENIKWDDVCIKIEENKQDVNIYIKDKYFSKIDYERMGFADRKTHDKPDKQWDFLLQMSTNKGEFDLNQTKNNEERARYRQYKKKASKTLQILFGINGDPFYQVKDSVYKTYFTLKPPPILRGYGEIFGTKDNDSLSKEDKDFYEEKTSNIYEDYGNNDNDIN